MPDVPAVPDVEELLELAVAALGGQRRDGQAAMARAVADAIQSQASLLVQAGTGTGKSLGYLAPAVRHAVVADQRVVVSTATLALQRQVMSRDLPLVAAALAPRLPRPPRFALLKGRHNYACLHKLAGGYPPDDGPALFDVPDADPRPRRPRVDEPLGAQVVRVREWASRTTSGDRDDLAPGVTDRAWRQVSVSARECLGQLCPLVDDCFSEQARRAAREADVVVTNHAVLGVVAGGAAQVLPEHDVLVVDEAHELPDRVTDQATVELSAGVVEQAGRLARRRGGIPTPTLDAAGAGLAAALAELPEGRFPAGLPEGPRVAVEAVRDAAREVLTALRPSGGANQPGGVDGVGGLRVATASAESLFDTAERMLADTDEHRQVLWCARSGDLPRLFAAPLDVAGLIRTRLLAGHAVILTSATLTLGGSFAPLAAAVGLEAAEEFEVTGPGPSPSTPDEHPAQEDRTAPTWRGIDVGSPFDHRRQGILYVARHLPPPARDPATTAQVDEIVELVAAAGGRTLGLFSSRRAAEVAAAAVRERVTVPVLVQGEDQLPALVARFAAEEATCLFGTLSLWQGVDVPGPACQLVIIDRIPFPRPDDPVASARADAVSAGGGNGFMAVSAARAALLLAQGAGRLLRTDRDRGVVAVLDPRLATARYGQFLLRSMPDFWRTSDRQVVLGALRRLAESSGGSAGSVAARATEDP